MSAGLKDLPRFADMDVIQTPFADRPPTPGEDGVRIVRHGLADILVQLGEEDIGPRPGAVVHRAFVVGGRMLVSPAVLAAMRAQL